MPYFRAVSVAFLAFEFPFVALDYFRFTLGFLTFLEHLNFSNNARENRTGAKDRDRMYRYLWREIHPF